MPSSTSLGRWNSLLIACAVLTAIEACNDVTISNTKYQKSREGTYRKQSDSCEGRPVYRQQNGDSYMFYLVTDTGWSGWMVGSTRCSNIGGIAAAQDVESPEKVGSSSWEEVYGGDWYYSSGLTVKCKSALTDAAIAGIVIACIIVVIIIIVIIACCCCKDTKRSNSVTANNSTTVIYTSNGSRHNNNQRAWIQRPVYNQGGPHPGSRGHYLGPATTPRGATHGGPGHGPGPYPPQNPQFYGPPQPPAYSTGPPPGAPAGVYPGGPAGPSASSSEPQRPPGVNPAYPPVNHSYPSEPPPGYTFEDKYMAGYAPQVTD